MRTHFLFILAAGLLLAADNPAAELVKQEKEKLQGTWLLIAAERDGASLPEEKVKALKLQVVISGDKLLHKRNGETVNEATYRIDPTAKPKTIDTTDKKGTVELGIYRLEKDRLTLCTSTKSEQQRPADFVTKAGSGHMLFKLERARP